MMNRQTTGAAAQMQQPPTVSGPTGKSPAGTSPTSANDKGLSTKQEPAGEAPAAQGAILMRSTGLGKAELVAEVIGLKRQGDYLIMELHTIKPVRWKIRAGLSHKDLRMLLKAMMKTSVLSFLLNLRGWFKEPKHPGDF